jgi:Kef-type K+ transport system membrane component KefB
VALSLVKDKEMDLPFVRYMLGILIVQDVLLGFILGFIPVLSSSVSEAPFAALRIIGSLILFLLISVVLYLFLVRILMNKTPKNSSELELSVSLAFCISLSLLADYLDISVEFACFIAGVVIASNELQGERTLKLIAPLRFVFSCLFFASIGLFIYPSFLIHQIYVLGLSTITLVALKCIICYIILRCLHVNNLKSLKISIGLSQISEFSLLLSSRAKNANIIGREEYYALLGVTVLSLLTTPLLWFISNRIEKCYHIEDDQAYESLDEESDKLE